MRRTTIVLIAIVGFACSVFAQSSSADQYPKREYFLGLSASGSVGNDKPVIAVNQRISSFFNEHAGGTNGFQASFIANFNKYAGIKGDFSAYVNNRRIGGGYFQSCVGTVCTASTQDFNVDSKALYLMAGPELKGRNHTRFTPFVHAQAGIVHSRSEFSTSGTLSFSDQTTDTGFSMAFGGGLDIRASRRVSIRAMMDYNPTFLKESDLGSRERQDHVRLSLGILFH
jgi:opacity protein-like surface antigen